MSTNAQSFAFGSRYTITDKSGVEFAGIVEANGADSVMIGLGDEPKQVVRYKDIASIEKVELKTQQKTAASDAIKRAVANGEGKYRS